MKYIPFCDLSRANNPLRKEIEKAISSCIDHSSFLRGRQTQLFEEEWATYCGQKYAVCCNSGTDALTLSALALEMKKAGIPSNTLPLTGIGLERGGAEVIIKEIGEDGWIKEPSEDDVPVLIFGRLPKAEVSSARLYDAAHAHGWQPPFGSIAAWSFYPTKSLGAMGDAGAVTTDDEALSKTLRELCGRDDILHNRRQITSRIDEIQAAVLRVKLRYMSEWLAMRNQIAQTYTERLSQLGIILTGNSLNHLFVVKVNHRDALIEFLNSRNIGTKVHWSSPLHNLEGPWLSKGYYGTAEKWCASVLSLPCYPGLESFEVHYVCDTIEDFYNQPVQ